MSDATVRVRTVERTAARRPARCAPTTLFRLPETDSPPEYQEGGLQPIWANVGNLRSQRNIKYNDLAYQDLGSEKPQGGAGEEEPEPMGAIGDVLRK